MTPRALRPVAYIAGPMTGYPLHNFPAFDAAKTCLEGDGYSIISPADMARDKGFDPALQDEVTPEFLRGCMFDDIEAVMNVDCLFMLPGWQRSKGAAAEYHLARWRGIPVFDFPKVKPVADLPESAVTDQAPPETPAPALPESAGSDLKKIAAGVKCPLHLLPPVSLRHTAWVHGEGAANYGPWNWRQHKIELPVYVGAIMRHTLAISSGEWFDPATKRPHAAHIAATCNILMDADAHGTLTR